MLNVTILTQLQLSLSHAFLNQHLGLSIFDPFFRVYIYIFYFRELVYIDYIL